MRTQDALCFVRREAHIGRRWMFQQPVCEARGHGGRFMPFFKEFKEFALKGNVIDMAVGIVVGVAFNKIVQSFVNDLLMPPIGMLLGGTDFSDLKLILSAAGKDDAGNDVPEVAVRYGQFANIIIEFVIIAFSAFIVVKVMNRIIKGREQAAA